MFDLSQGNWWEDSPFVIPSSTPTTKRVSTFFGLEPWLPQRPYSHLGKVRLVAGLALTGLCRMRRSSTAAGALLGAGHDSSLTMKVNGNASKLNKHRQGLLMEYVLPRRPLYHRREEQLQAVI